MFEIQHFESTTFRLLSFPVMNCFKMFFFAGEKIVLGHFSRMQDAFIFRHSRTPDRLFFFIAFFILSQMLHFQTDYGLYAHSATLGPSEAHSTAPHLNPLSALRTTQWGPSPPSTLGSPSAQKNCLTLRPRGPRQKGDTSWRWEMPVQTSSVTPYAQRVCKKRISKLVSINENQYSI